jgi:HAD superfamily hydrolase (TIGR01509 family)
MHPIKAILFDLDGVLVNSRVLHYETFRDALQSIKPSRNLPWSKHEKEFDGLSTKLKIQKCIQKGWISSEEGQPLFELKQRLTLLRLPSLVKPRESLKLMLITLNNQGFRLFCCSNSVRNTLDATLNLLGVREFFEATYSNEDVQNPKPSPELYELAMRQCFLNKAECLIVEDSRIGREAAYASGAHVLEVEDAEDVTLSMLREALYTIEKKGNLYPRSIPYGKPITFHIVIPMAGEGSRFREAGYTIPKPFIPVGGKPMVSWVIQNMIPKDIPVEHYKLKFHLIVRSSHVTGNRLDSLFWDVPSNVSYTYHTTDGLTEGAACSVLLAEGEINNNDPLLIVNSDQYLEWNPDVFYKCMLNPEYDGTILTFYQPNPYDLKWSYAKVSDDGFVTEVQEKKWISPYATVGLYGWRRGADYVKYAKQMIEKNIRVKNEFYVCPVYNESIGDGQHVRVKLCTGMWGLGVPEDLQTFQKEFLGEGAENT